jgi:tetratricopeptide (TPR) repeat protein
MNQDLLLHQQFLVFRISIGKCHRNRKLYSPNLFFCLFLLFQLSPLNSQQLKIDSLNKLLGTSNPDTNRVNLYYYLSDSFYDSDPHKSIDYAKKGLSLSGDIGFKHGMSICLSAIGLAYYQLGDFDSSLFYFKRRYKLVNDIGDRMGIATACDNLGVIFFHYGKIDSALAFRNRANEIYISLNKKNNLAGGYTWVGNIYKEQGDYSSALDYYLKSLRIYEDENDNEKAGYPLLNISSIYRYLKEYDKAKAFASDAKLKFSKANNENAVGISLYRLSLIYYEEKDYDNSIKYLQEAKAIFEKVSNNYFLTLTNSVLGTCYLAKENLNEAFSLFMSTLDIAKSIGDLSLLSTYYMNISAIYSQKGNYQKSLVYSLRADSLLTKLKDNNTLAENSTNLIELYCHINKPDSILKYFHRFHELTDTIYHDRNLKAIAEMQSKYESEKKDQQLQFQRTELKNKNFIIKLSVTGAGIVMAMLVLIVILYRSKDKAYKRLVYQNLVPAIENQKQPVSHSSDRDRSFEMSDNGKFNISTLDDEHKKQILDCLIKSIESKVFTEPNLSIRMLAERCGTNRSYLSKVINETYNMNYTTYINKLRIDEAICIISDINTSVPLKELYQKLGFNSYSVFNEAFKKFIGVTPAYFQKTAKKMQKKVNFSVSSQRV